MKNEITYSMINWKNKTIWIGLGAIALLVRAVFAAYPGLAESFYSRGIYQGIRFLLDYTIGLFPIASLYVITAAALFFLLFKLIQRIKRGKKINEKKPRQIRLLSAALSPAAFLGAVVFIFYFTWGFNYQRLPIEDHLKINVEPLDAGGIRKEAHIALQMAITARENIPGASEKDLGSGFIPDGLENTIRSDLKRVLKSLGYPAPGRVRARKIWPAGLMMSFGISGIYFPFTGEAHIPADLPAMTRPFTMAHEMAHGFGFTEEGTANFLAYLACISSKNPVIRYSGCLNYLSYISSDLLRVSREEYIDMIKKLPKGMIADRRAVSAYWARYYNWLMDVGEKINDTYLKSQGIKEGVKSYNRLVILAAAWRNAFGDQGALLKNRPLDPGKTSD